MASCKHTREKYKSLKFSFQQKLASTTETRLAQQYSQNTKHNKSQSLLQ